MAARETAGSDDDSAEGAVARSLFWTESDSEEEWTGDKFDDIWSAHQQPPADGAIPQADNEEVFVERSIMNLVIAEQVVGGSIAHRLWPAAKYLAEYVLEFNESKTDPRRDAVSDESRNSARASIGSLLRNASHDKPLQIIELGAGIGLTGLKLATELPCRVILTDLENAMPLLRRNMDLNRDKFRCGPDAVDAKVLNWGEDIDSTRTLSLIDSSDPLLVLASDCVYFEGLHLPLEQTIASLLSRAPQGSVCLIASARRWKRDNSFFANLGHKTKTFTHRIHCACLQETVTRDTQQREILRVFAVQWIPTNTTRIHNSSS